jgi:hypothetical protein
MEIFHKKYYPDVFKSWYMDDWISRVYGRLRTIPEHRTEAVHATDSHGTRYQVDDVVSGRMEQELSKGKQMIIKHMRNYGAPQLMIDQYLNDEFDFIASEKVAQDIPLIQMGDRVR